MKIFCVGIGGIGLSGVAQILKANNHEVSGSDLSDSELTSRLKSSGISVDHEHQKENIDDSFNLLIYSEAIPESNPERTEALRLGIKQISYAQALGMISENKKTIAITGTHGKTTVTGMLTSIFLEGDIDPTIIIGSKIDKLDNNNFRVGKGDIFLAEACEYRNNFLHLSPSIVLINNLEPDHLDFFKTPENYYDAFQKLCEKIPEDGSLILSESDKVHLDPEKISAQKKYISNEEKFELQVPGEHNQRNAAAAAAVAKAIGISAEFIRKGLENFHGTWRRFEFKGNVKGAKIYDDYGHHPTEIAATIEAAREWYPEKKLVIIFQPHQYSRTRHFFEAFITSFTGADEVWITDIYMARDDQEDIDATSAQHLADGVSDPDQVRYIPLEEVSAEIQKSADADSIFVIMGAGNIGDVIKDLKYDES